MPDDNATPVPTVAALQRELAAARAERDEALAQQQALADVLDIINSSPGDLQPVFDAILEKATGLCEAAFGVMLTWDGEAFHRVAFHGVPPGFIEMLRQPQRPGPGTMAERLVRGEQIISNEDLRGAGWDQSGAGAQALIQYGARSHAVVALRNDKKLLGLITVYRTEVRPFTDKQIALLQNFAAQAVIAMENARLITETREALDQQTATAEVLGVINSSPGDLAPVFDAMLEKALRLCEAAFGALNTWDGEHLHRAAWRGAPGELTDNPQWQQPLAPPPGSFGDRLIHGEDVIAIADLSDEKTTRGSPAAEALARLGARSYVVVALRKDEKFLGIIMIYRLEVRPFTDKQIALLENFAAQAVIAMENARLITETREALEQQTATAEVLGVINSSPGDLQPVFDAMLDKALSLCEAKFGNIATYDGASFSFAAAAGHPEFDEWARRHGPGEPGPGSTMERMIRGENVIHIADIADDEPYRAGLPVRRALVEIGGFRSLLGVALRREDALLGMFHIYRQEVRPFTNKQIALLQNFAAQAVIAMENARLLTETREALEQQTATAEVLGVINASPGDLAPVFDAMLERAAGLCDLDFASLWTHDGSAFRPVARHRVADVFWEYLQSHTPPSFTRLLQGERMVCIPDLQQLPEYAESDFTRRAREMGLEAELARSLLMVPLLGEGALRGVIVAYRLDVKPFTDKQIALLQNFAAQAVIAMENARLLGELRERNDEIAGWNQELEVRVAQQLAEIERAGKLRRFLAPQLADLIVAQGDDKILESHRREIVVVFCDLRGLTAFAERAEPEEVMALLKEYHAAMGPIVARYEGTIDHYGGDGIMVFFNDPVPTPDPARRAIDMAVAMRENAQPLLRQWRRHGHDLGFGVGVAQGYATLGQIGFAERMDYTAIGTVTNLAARLCAEASNGQILISARVAAAVEDELALEEIGDLALKGLSQAVAVYNVPRAEG